MHMQSGDESMYTVKQLSDLAGVSVRTLHHYDDIALLKPTAVGQNGYRFYDDAALLRLQQILFYREIGLELMQIKEVLSSPDFDLIEALRSHRKVLNGKIDRLKHLVQTVDSTIKHLAGDEDMSKKKLFEGFSKKKQKQYEREMRLQYGPDIVNDSVKRYNGYSQAQRDAIKLENDQIYRDIVKAIKTGNSPQSVDVQAVMQRWHEAIRYFYEPTTEIMRGLGQLYTSHPDFIANFQKLHRDLPQYLEDAITQYVDNLEHAELVRMLAEDDEKRAAG